MIMVIDKIVIKKNGCAEREQSRGGGYSQGACRICYTHPLPHYCSLFTAHYKKKPVSERKNEIKQMTPKAHHIINHQNPDVMKKKLYTLFIVVCMAGFSAMAQTEHVVNVGDDLIQTIADASSGDIILVKQGVHKASYTTIDLTDKSLKIIGEPGEEKPTVYVKEIAVTGTRGDIDLHLERLEFSGAVYDSLAGVEDLVSTPASYLVNFTSDHDSINNLTFKNCVIRNFDRCVLRADRSANFADSIVVDDCIVTDLRGGGDYGPFRTKSNIKYNYLIVKNSTFYNIVERFINLENGDNLHPYDIQIKNVTFYKWGGKKTGQYLFDLRFNDVATDNNARLSITDCIFGKTNDDPEVPITVNGWRMNESTYAGITATVMTPDFVLTAGTFAEAPWDVNTYNETNFTVPFADPDVGDFTLPVGSPLLQMSSSGGVVGDPRWDPDYVSVPTTSADAFRVYPNPASGLIRLSLKKPADVFIYNITGRMVMTLPQVEPDKAVDVSGLQPGLYFLKTSRERTGTVKLMIR